MGGTRRGQKEAPLAEMVTSEPGEGKWRQLGADWGFGLCRFSRREMGWGLGTPQHILLGLLLGQPSPPPPSLLQTLGQGLISEVLEGKEVSPECPPGPRREAYDTSPL